VVVVEREIIRVEPVNPQVSMCPSMTPDGFTGPGGGLPILPMSSIRTIPVL